MAHLTVRKNGTEWNGREDFRRAGVVWAGGGTRSSGLRRCACSCGSRGSGDGGKVSLGFMWEAL